MNLLSQETSPYLLQHANNPVHWKPWNSASLQEAKNNNQLIIISIGYSACHWCHVMEHESFENEDVAAVMNKDFVSIKIDREERPDVDAVYMKAIQIMTGQGGWPLNVITLPDGRPVWGGTYFRKNEWINALQQLQNLYEINPAKMIEYAEKLHNGIQSYNIIEKQEVGIKFNPIILEQLVAKWKPSFDHEYGGMARAPKFMVPNNYQFLLQYAHENNDKEVLDFVHLTLTKMAHGGLFDPIGGGFSRYSVDAKWHIPHFEKMLYDNAQLISLYAEAYKQSKNELYKEIIEKTVEFVETELANGKGGYYCALDADSLTNEGHLEEGAFYVWTKAELQQELNNDFDLFAQIFNVNEFGHWENGNYVLIQNKDLEVIAAENNISIEVLKTKKSDWEKKLHEVREKRNKPRLDDKTLTSWNGLIIKGFVDAFKAFSDKKYHNLALHTAHFILENLLSKEGHLLHNYKNKKSTINGYLEDYAFVIEGFISLYEVTLDEKWITISKKLVDYTIKHFYYQEEQLFSFTSSLDAPLIAQHFEIEDQVIASSNSVMANNLLKMSYYFDDEKYEVIMQKMLEKIIPAIEYPSAFSNWLRVYTHSSEKNKQLIICGEKAVEFTQKINALYLPTSLIIAGNKKSDFSLLKNKFQESKTLFYVCQNKTCNLPTENFDVIINQLAV
jgi:uncharacterized protein